MWGGGKYLAGSLEWYFASPGGTGTSFALKMLAERKALCHFSLIDSWTDSRGVLPLYREARGKKKEEKRSLKGNP